jgi:hypothetical protein
MITICKKCRAALNETLEQCADCGTPNPWFADLYGVGLNPWSAQSIKDSQLGKSLASLGAIDLCLTLGGLMSLMGTPWAALPLVIRLMYSGAALFAAGNLTLALRFDLASPAQRLLARVLIAANCIWVVFFLWLGRTSRL